MNQNETEEVNNFYRDLTYLALAGAPHPSAVESLHHRFLSLILHGKEKAIQKKLRCVAPQVAGLVYECIADYLDNVRAPGMRWTNSVAVLVTLAGGQRLHRPRLLPEVITRIQGLFDIPCRVEPRLLSPGEIDDIRWQDWLWRSRSRFQDQGGKPEFELAVRGDDQVGDDGWQALLLDFQTVNCSQDDLLDLVNARLGPVCEILEGPCPGLSADLLSSVVSAHLASMRCEQLKIQRELIQWESLVEEKGVRVQWDRRGKEDQLTLWREGARHPVATMRTKAAHPWTQAARLAMLKDWLEDHPGVTVLDTPARSRRLHADWRAALKQVPVMNYEMIPEAPQTTPIGYCLMSQLGPVLDDTGSVNVTLTAREAANMAWRIKVVTGRELTVASLPFEALYSLARQGIPLLVTRQVYVRLWRACRTCCPPDHPIRLPMPDDEPWLRIEPEWIWPVEKED